MPLEPLERAVLDSLTFKCLKCPETFTLANKVKHTEEQCAGVKLSCPTECGTDNIMGCEQLLIHLIEGCHRVKTKFPQLQVYAGINEMVRKVLPSDSLSLKAFDKMDKFELLDFLMESGKRSAVGNFEVWFNKNNKGNYRQGYFDS